MTTLTISHSPEEGTLLTGSRKGDGVYEILVGNLGWRYFRSLRQIGLQGSRDKVAPRRRIADARTALEAAGFTVDVEIDDTIRDRATVLADQAVRLEERADRLTERAGRHAANAEAAWRRSDQISGAFEGGQPILVGHHSERRARRDQERMHNAMARSVAEDAAANYAAGQASAVGAQAVQAAQPDATARRIEKQEKELRDLEKHLAGREPTTDYLFELVSTIAQLRDRIGYDRASVQAAIDAGTWVWHNASTVHVGDVVYSQGLGRGEIAKVNKVTIDVETGNMPWPLKQRYTQIRRVVCPHTTEASVEGS